MSYASSTNNTFKFFSIGTDYIVSFVNSYVDLYTVKSKDDDVLVVRFL